MINRRNFLRRITAVPALSLLSSQIFAKEISKNLYPNNEDYWREISAKFPITKNRIYLNAATMGTSPQVVIDSQIEKMTLVDSFGEYGKTDESREKIAQFVAAQADEICLTHNTTEGINIVCWGLKLKKGDEILLTNHEHVGGALPWLNRAKIDQLKVIFFELGANADATLSNLKNKITPKTKVIAIPHIVCTIGQVQPIKEIATWAKKQGIKVVVDGAHGLGLLNLNLQDLAVDYYAACCHKWLCGPKGTAFLYVAKSAQDSMQPLFVGADSDTGWNVNLPPTPSISGYVDSAHRYDYGTQNTALWQGANTAIDFFADIGMDKVEKRTQELATYFMDALQENEKYSILTPRESVSYAGIVAFRPLHTNYKDCNEMLLKKGNIRLRVVPEHGLNCIRASFHIYNLKEQIDVLVEGLK